MKGLVVLGVTLLAAGVAVLALYTWITWGEAQENRYSDYVEARESLRRGWLPATLPKSATEIHEWHDLDTNRCFGSFRFDPKDRSAIEAKLRSGLRKTIDIDRDPSFASPLPLPRDPDEQQLAGAGFEFYSARDFDVAINWNTGIAYYWN